MKDLVKRFLDIFDGLDRAYGTYQINSKRVDGKQLGDAVTLKKPVNEALWLGHLTGKTAIGIIPIKDNSCCKFGAIDIDVYASLNISSLCSLK